MSELRIFRDLSGINDLGAVDRWGYRTPAVDDLSRQLFGIAEEDTYLDRGVYAEADAVWRAQRDEADGRPLMTNQRQQMLATECPSGQAELEWELKFELTFYEFGAAKPVWEAMGWDVSDGDDGEHQALHGFSRQLICAIHGVAGHLPTEEGLAVIDAQAFEERLAADRDAYLSKKGRTVDRGPPSHTPGRQVVRRYSALDPKK